MSDDWKAKLPESIRASSLVKDVDTEEKFWKRIQDQQSYLGQSIRIPSDDAGADALNEFHAKLKAKVPSLLSIPKEDDDAAYDAALEALGKPKQVADYTLPEVQGFTFSEDQATHLRALADKSAMTKRQFKKLAKEYAAEATRQSDAAKAEKDANEGLLQKEWGMAVNDKYQEVVEFAKANGAPQNFVRALEGRTARAEEVMFMHKLAKSGKESSTVASAGNGQSPGGKLTPYEAEERIAEILNNRNHPYHKGDKMAQRRFVELVEMAGAGQ